MIPTYNCIILDDNKLDQLMMVSYVKKYPFLKIAGVYTSAADALAEIEQTNPSVLFSDIDMPEMTGLELRKKLNKIPACVFITSYPDYAVESFDVDALDFLLKPLTPARMQTMMERLETYLQIYQKSVLFDFSHDTDCIYIKEGWEQIKINLKDVIYLEALKDYTSIVTSSKKYCVHSLLGNLLKEKGFLPFIRIHKSYAVQKHFVNKISTGEVFVNDISLPIGRKYKDAFL